MSKIIDDYKKRMNYDMWVNVVKFPRTPTMFNRDMDRIVKEARDIEQRSKELLDKIKND